MFGWRWQFKRLLRRGAQVGSLSPEDVELLEVLGADLLKDEARAMEIAAGRAGAEDPHKRSLQAARIWREFARRTGLPIALRNAALAAERAVQGFKGEARAKAWAAARCEQALGALLAAELYGDDTLTLAAEEALRDTVAAAPLSPCAAVAHGQLVRLSSRAAMASGGYDEAKTAAAAFDAPIANLTASLKGRNLGRGMLADLHCDRAQMLIGCGARLRDPRLLHEGAAELDRLAERLDAVGEPVALSRVESLRASARVGLGETLGRIDTIAEGVELLVQALEQVAPDHRPLDWARLQHGLAKALQSLGEGSESDRAFEQALSCYGRALWITRDLPALTLRGVVAQNQASCLARRAELAADPSLLNAAVETLRRGLAKLDPRQDPVGWAIAQVNLAQLYRARLDLGIDPGDRAAAALALDGAIEVFGEHGLKSLAEQAKAALETLRARPGRAA